MASEIKVDTISEKTSANGVAIDSVTLKDGVIEATGDTAAGDNAAMGYTSAEGLILTGQGSTNDITIKNDADADVLEIPTGTTNVTVVGSFTSGAGGAVGAQGTATSLAGIPFFYGDTGSIYTHDVSGTDSTATYNTAYGLTAFDAITTADSCTAVGYGAGGALTTGGSNTLVGALAGAAMVDGDGNVCVGTNAGNDITSGANNIAIGQDALAQTTTTDANIAIGRNALQLPDTEANNMAIGHTTMSGSVAGGEYNVAIGNNTFDALTSADNSIAIGYEAASALTTGGDSVIIGRSAGNAITTSGHNTIIGSNAGYGTTGNGNVIVGSYAMNSAGASIRNVCVGQYAGYEITTGDNNIFLGYTAGRSTSPSGAITTGSNTICLGSSDISASHIQTDWTVASDKRDKTDVEAMNMGLDFVNKLEPVTYRWDKRDKYEDSTPTGEHKEDWLDVGFLAQDVELLEKEYGYKMEDKTNLTFNLSEDGNKYGLTYSKFVPILVKAVQELSAEVKALKEGK